MREELRLVSHATFSVATASVTKVQYLLKPNDCLVNVFSMIYKKQEDIDMNLRRFKGFFLLRI